MVLVKRNLVHMVPEVWHPGLKPFEVGVHCIYPLRGIDAHIWNLSLHGQRSWNNSFILGRGVGANTEMYNWNVHGR